MNKQKTIDKIKSNLKVAATLAVGLGVGEIVANAVKDSKPDANGIGKLFIKLGAVALTAMIVDKVNNYVEDQIDEVFDEGQKMYERMMKMANGEKVEENEESLDDANVIGLPAFFEKEEAEMAMTNFRNYLKKFNVLSVAAAKSIINIGHELRDEKYGWTDLDDMVLLEDIGAYTIRMPQMKRLE